MKAFDPNYLLSLPPRVTEQSYTKKDVMLYALGVGAGQVGGDTELPFVFEQDLKVLPTMAVVLGYPGFWQMEPQYGITWQKLLHAEQSVRFERPFPVEGAIRSELTIDSIVDKGSEKGALLYSRRRITAADSGDLLATVVQVSFLRADGGKGGSQVTAPSPHAIPDRDADIVTAASTRPEQALIYRLSGDYNPLHADPAVAREAGLPRPILHGLCTYGIVGRLVLGQLCGNDPVRMKRLDCRFTAPVFPGDDLRVSIWKDATGRAAFRVDVPERNVTAINNGYVEFIA